MSRTRKTKRILYVEDLKNMADVVIDFLGKHGYEVVHVYTADAFMEMFPSLDEIRVRFPGLLDKWDETAPHRNLDDLIDLNIGFIMLDHELLGSQLTGLGLLKWMARARPYYNNIPRIMYTSMASRYESGEAIRWGAKACIDRHEHDLLLETIREWMGPKATGDDPQLFDWLKSKSESKRFFAHKIQETSGHTLPVYIWGERGTSLHEWAQWISRHSFADEEPKDVCIEYVDQFSDDVQARKEATVLEEKLSQRVSCDVAEIKQFHLAARPAQTVLLQFIEEHTNIRVICTGREDPDAAFQSGKLLPELYEHFVGRIVELPPLRVRIAECRPEFQSDVMREFNRYRAVSGGAEIEIDGDAWDVLCDHPWPRNDWELKHVVQCLSHKVEGSDLTRRVITAPLVRECIAGVGGVHLLK